MEDSQVAAALSAQLTERIGQQRFDLWFNQQANIGVRGTVLTIRASSSFVRDWMRSHFSHDIRNIWESIVGAAGAIEFELEARTQDTVQSSPKSAPEAVSAQRPRKSTSASAAPIPSVTASAALADPSGPRRNASLSGFVVGPSNEYAMRSAELTARGRQQASPLLFVGPTGVGKTHLLRGIQQEYRRHHPGAIALYLTAEQFTTNFVEALRGSGIPSFRQKCRGAQLLAIDDLQFFPGKRRTVEELLYTIDTLGANGRQIVLASDRGPAQLRGLGPELISRLAGGLTCEMVSPGFATRVEIVRKLADEVGMVLEDDVAVLIATQISSGARELGGALHRLRAMSAAYNEPITKTLAERGLAELARHNTRAVRLADVQKVVCEAFGVEPVQLRSDRKARGLAEPRMLAMWLARKYTRAPWSEIGEFFGRNSHSTVISAHRRVEKLIAAEAQIGMADQSCQVDEAIRRLESALRTA
ncbi:MAG TPA: chromosomal replication initiator protein DnaA [Lacipirellulaceae bacterium]|nr:chromosomal replication initiator protein DnaA [Lacipirellulaceae bacterium]